MQKLCLGLSFATMVLFVACDSSGTNANMDLLGVSSNSSSESDGEYDGEVEKFGELPRCSEKKKGKVYYVKDEKVSYTCRYEENEGEWVRKKKKHEDDDQEFSSSSKKETSSSGSEVIGSSISKGFSSSSSETENSSVSESSSCSSSNAISSSSKVYSSSDASIYDAATNTLTDLRDGQVYRTTTIDVLAKNYSEVWMAENLNYKTRSSFCYDDKSVNCSKYGRLYTWTEAVEGRGVCPKDWHVPSQSEWNALFIAVGGSDIAGKMLKSKTGWISHSGTENADAFGFSALPAGCRPDYGKYNLEGYVTYFWSSTEDDRIYAYHMGLDFDYDDTGLYSTYKYSGFSIRCLKD